MTAMNQDVLAPVFRLYAINAGSASLHLPLQIRTEFGRTARRRRSGPIVNWIAAHRRANRRRGRRCLQRSG